MKDMNNNGFSSEDIIKVLDALYQRTIDGIGVINSCSVSQMADDYLLEYCNPQIACRKMLKYQIAKCTTSGVISGFGGVLTMPVAIPANICNVLYVQMRMVACTAYMAGFDLHSDQVQTLVYACLAGVSITSVVKQSGIKAGSKLAIKAIERIPGKTLTKFNQKIGFRFITKFGEKGIVNLGKLVPGVGAVINGGVDYFETKAIGNRAFKMFFESDCPEDC